MTCLQPGQSSLNVADKQPWEPRDEHQKFRSNQETGADSKPKATKRSSQQFVMACNCMTAQRSSHAMSYALLKHFLSAAICQCCSKLFPQNTSLVQACTVVWICPSVLVFIELTSVFIELTSGYMAWFCQRQVIGSCCLDKPSANTWKTWSHQFAFTNQCMRMHLWGSCTGGPAITIAVVLSIQVQCRHMENLEDAQCSLHYNHLCTH